MKKRFRRNIRKCKRRNSDAQYEIVFILEYGLIENDIIIIASDKEQSFFYYQQSSSNENIDSTLRYAGFLSEGVWCDKNIPLSIELYMKCIQNDSQIASDYLATVYRDMKNYVEAFKYYKISMRRK